MDNCLLLLLLIVSLLLFLFEYTRTKNDLSDPVVGFFLFFSMSLFCALLGNVRWGNVITLEYTGIVILCFAATWLGGRIGRLIHKRHDVKTIESMEVFLGPDRIDVKKYKVVFVVGLSVILTVLYAANVMRLGRGLGATGLAAIAAVRGAKDVSTNFVIRQGIKFTMAAGYVNSFIFINNSISKKFRKTDFVYMIPTICGCICSLFTGVRTEIFRLVLALFVYACVINNQKKKWKGNNGTFRYIVKKFGFPTILIMFVFFGLRNIIKVSSTLAENTAYSVLEYILFYVGSPWIVLNNKMKMGLDLFRGNHFGELTFSRLWQDLEDFGIVNLDSGLTQTAYTIVDLHKGSFGNVDTMFGNLLVDFGMIGTMIFSLVLCMLLSMFYKRYIVKSYGSYKRNRQLIVYAFLYYMIGLGFYSNIFSSFLSVYFLLTLSIIYIIFWFYFKMNIKIRGN